MRTSFFSNSRSRSVCKQTHKNRQGERVDRCWTKRWSWTSSTELEPDSPSLCTYPTPGTYWDSGLSSFTSKQRILGQTLEQAGMLVAAIFGFE